jgi:hypothetical protein
LETRWNVVVCGLLAAALLARCATGADSSGASESSPGAGGAKPDAGSDGSAGSGGTAGTGGAPPPPPPPEVEIEGSYRSPVSTGRYVWSANPDSGRVAVVDAKSLDVRTFEAGFGPTHLAALPGGADRAIVINVHSDDATLFEVEQLDAPPGVETVPVHDGANAWSIGASGRWAIAWSDAALVEDPDPTEGFQDVTLIDLSESPPRATRLSVGYRPTRIVIASDEARAFAVCEPGVSVIELDGELAPRVAVDVPVTDDPLEDPASRDVSITPDGRLALVRRDFASTVGVVSLVTGERVAVELGGAVTDLDLTEDGSLAVAVVRETSSVAVLHVPAIFEDPTGFEMASLAGESVGSIAMSPDGTAALLFTNATASDRLTVLNTAIGRGYLGWRTVALKAAVRAVFPMPDARHAIALLEPGANSSKAGAFGVVPVADELPPKIQGTDAPPTAVALEPGPDGAHALLTVRGDSDEHHAAYLVAMPALQVDMIPLASPPLATGIVAPAGVGWVAQEHPEGRLTVIDLVRGTARTLTGYELAAEVVDGP